MKSLFTLAVIFTLNLLVGCASSQLSSGNSNSQAGVAIQFQDAMNQSNGDALNKLLDADHIIQETVSAMDVSLTETVVMWAALRTVLSTALTERLLDTVESSEGLAEYRGRTKKGELIRINMMDKGLSYIELIINDKSKVADIFLYSEGRLLSDKLFSAINLFKDDNVSLKDKETLKEGTKLYKEKNFSAAFSRLNSLPESVKSTPLVSFLLLEVGSHDDANHTVAMKNFSKYHNDNPDYAFMLIDNFLYDEDYSQALKNIKKVDSYLENKDGYIALMEFNAYMLLGNKEKAKVAAKLAERREPENEFLLSDLLDLYVSYELYEESVEAIKVLNAKFNYGLTPSLLKEAGFEKLSKSAAFIEWEQAFK